jgi:hypothetical protein
MNGGGYFLEAVQKLERRVEAEANGHRSGVIRAAEKPDVLKRHDLSRAASRAKSTGL